MATPCTCISATGRSRLAYFSVFSMRRRPRRPPSSCYTRPPWLAIAKLRKEPLTKDICQRNKSPYVPNAADSFVRATILSTTSLTAKHQIINSSCTWICGLPLDKHGRPRRANSTSGYHAFCFPQRWMLGDLLEDLNAPFQLCKHERAVPSMFAELLDSRFQLLPKNSSN